MSKRDKYHNKPSRQASGLGWAKLSGGLGRLALYLSLVACLWVVLVAIGLALFRRAKRDYLANVYKPMP